MRKYTYKDWLEGKVVFTPKKDCITVTWDNFNKTETSKIRKKQFILYHEAFNKLCDMKTQFINSYYKTNQNKLREKLFKHEIETCYKILYGRTFLQISNMVYIKWWGIAVELNYILNVQKFIKENETINNLDFISPEKDSKPDYRIFAKFIKEYYQWLMVNTNPYPYSNPFAKEKEEQNQEINQDKNRSFIEWLNFIKKKKNEHTQTDKQD